MGPRAYRTFVGGSLQGLPGGFGQLLSGVLSLHRAQSGSRTDGRGSERISMVELRHERVWQVGCVAWRACVSCRTGFGPGGSRACLPRAVFRGVVRRAGGGDPHVSATAESLGNRQVSLMGRSPGGQVCAGTARRTTTAPLKLSLTSFLLPPTLIAAVMPKHEQPHVGVICFRGTRCD